MSVKLEAFCFKYSDGTIKEIWLSSPKMAAEYAHNEGDHLINWWAGRLPK